MNGLPLGCGRSWKFWKDVKTCQPKYIQTQQAEERVGELIIVMIVTARFWMHLRNTDWVMVI